MAEPTTARPVKVFVVLLAGKTGKSEEALEKLVKVLGPIDFKSRQIPFNQTHYYAEEMGEELYRSFISFEKMISPESIVNIKLATNRIENELTDSSGKRTINLDPGYLDFNKVILASGKFGSQKIYLNEGIWADLTLWFKKGHYHPFEWTFPDFKDSRYEADLLRMRELYKDGLRDRPQ